MNFNFLKTQNFEMKLLLEEHLICATCQLKNISLIDYFNLFYRRHFGGRNGFRRPQVDPDRQERRLRGLADSKPDAGIGDKHASHSGHQTKGDERGPPIHLHRRG